MHQRSLAAKAANERRCETVSLHQEKEKTIQREAKSYSEKIRLRKNELLIKNGSTSIK